MLIQLTPADDEAQMWLVCHDEGLRYDIVSDLEKAGQKIADDAIFDKFDILPKQRNVVLAIEHLGDLNLRPVLRYFLAHADSWAKLAVAKREWDDESKHHLEDILNEEKEAVEAQCASRLEKIGNLPDCEWKSEREEKLHEWVNYPHLQYSTVTVGPCLKEQLETSFPSFLPFEVHDSEGPVANKPPVLHWATLPLDGELQIILRISFMLTGPDDSVFKEIRKNLRQYGERQYEWTNGILITQDAVRIHLERLTNNQLEIAGRVSVDELEGDAVKRPLAGLWPFMGVALKHIFTEIDQLQHVAYSIELVPFTESFYKPPMAARAFEVTSFFATANTKNRVASKVNNETHEVDLNLLFPDGPFDSLSALTALEPPVSPRSSRAESLQDQHDTVTPLDTSGHGSLTVTPNKGRRVSFGSIKLMTESPKKNGGVEGFVDAMIKDSMELRTLYVE